MRYLRPRLLPPLFCSFSIRSPRAGRDSEWELELRPRSLRVFWELPLLLLPPLECEREGPLEDDGFLFEEDDPLLRWADELPLLFLLLLRLLEEWWSSWSWP